MSYASARTSTGGDVGSNGPSHDIRDRLVRSRVRVTLADLDGQDELPAQSTNDGTELQERSDQFYRLLRELIRWMS
jgi:hypothetical protein